MPTVLLLDGHGLGLAWPAPLPHPHASRNAIALNSTHSLSLCPVALSVHFSSTTRCLAIDHRHHPRHRSASQLCTVRLSVILVLYDVAAANRSGLPARLLSLSHILSPDTFHAAPKHPRRRSNDPLTTAPSQTPFLCNPLPPASHCLISSGHLPTGITRRQSSTPPM